MSEEFDLWFRRMRKFFEEFDRMIEDMLREAWEAERRPPSRRGYYYGFSITIGPDGIPRVKEWGNIRPGVIRPKVMEAVEPFTDVIEEPDKIKIIVDMPGVEKEDIKVRATEDKVVISAEHGDRKYYKEVILPNKVKPETAKAQYKNGVLTITLERLEKKPKEEGFEVKIE